MCLILEHRSWLDVCHWTEAHSYIKTIPFNVLGCNKCLLCSFNIDVFSFVHVLGMQHAHIQHCPLSTALLTTLCSEWEVRKTSIDWLMPTSLGVKPGMPLMDMTLEMTQVINPSPTTMACGSVPMITTMTTMTATVPSKTALGGGWTDAMLATSMANII